VLNTVYRLIEPRRIEAEFRDLSIAGPDVLVRPTFLSICKADQRYFQGTRSAEILRKKLPMALVHEAVGKVLYDPEGDLKPGTRVVMVPNTPAVHEAEVAENYLTSSKFRGSNMDGFMQDIVAISRDRIIEISDDLDDLVASFTELVSVSYHAISRLSAKANSCRDKIGVWGDGNLAFITSLLLKRLFSDSKIFVFGKHDYKMREFVFADECCHIDEVPEGLIIDHAIECVGNSGSGRAINQIIDHIRPEGCIAAMGVSEDAVPINTRMILEKGLTLFGNSRSGANDFKKVLELYGEYPEITEYLSRIVGTVAEVHSINDMIDAFDADFKKASGKTIMVWSK